MVCCCMCVSFLTVSLKLLSDIHDSVYIEPKLTFKMRIKINKNCFLQMFILLYSIGYLSHQ